MLSSERACGSIEHLNERTVALGLGRLTVFLLLAAACVRQVRFEGSRITMLRVRHRATNESHLHPSALRSFLDVCFLAALPNIEDRWDRRALAMW